ncbi:MAG: 3-methyladenine DNA glycosylase AlkC [Candidatus Azotimanducaceae bacterium]|jgi:3-methyladenine DNA glycosylase AlkC
MDGAQCDEASRPLVVGQYGKHYSMAIKAETSFSLKDQLFNAQTVAKFSTSLSAVLSGFKKKQFEKEILDRFPKLELKARIGWIVSVLSIHLPDEFESALRILENALPPPLDPKKTDDDFGEFIWAVPGEYVARFGCTKQNLTESLAFLQKSTMRFTAENSIRPFLRHFPDETLAFVRDCAVHKNYHVRRLASEGIRPFLPWAERANVDPAQIFDIIELLKLDETRYVIRSVANTLNDLSKIDPGQVIKTLTSWQQKPSKEMTWMTRHALRTLIKQDHADALSLLGYPINPDFRVSNISATTNVAVGDNLNYQCLIRSNADQNLRIALRIHYLKANGSHSSRVFAVKDIKVASGKQLQIDKKVSFRPITTRALYQGAHHVEIVVNGIARGRKTFDVH